MGRDYRGGATVPATGNRQPATGSVNGSATGSRQPATGSRQRKRVRQPAAGNRQPLPATIGILDACADIVNRIESFRDLEVWQVSMTLVEHVFRLTDTFPAREFDLRRQMRRAAVSIPANVSEGYRRRRTGAYQNHVSIALGSQGELDTELEITLRSQLASADECRQALILADRVGAMLFRLFESLGG